MGQACEYGDVLGELRALREELGRGGLGEGPSGNWPGSVSSAGRPATGRANRAGYRVVWGRLPVRAGVRRVQGTHPRARPEPEAAGGRLAGLAAADGPGDGQDAVGGGVGAGRGRVGPGVGWPWWGRRRRMSGT